MRECAYARAFRSSQERAAALPRWLHLYNVHRPHTALAGQPPISRLAMNYLLGNDLLARPASATSTLQEREDLPEPEQSMAFGLTCWQDAARAIRTLRMSVCLER
jgi:hypothetical protein